ncbi:MAG: ATP-binding cassette domain-containing protein [Bacteroidetes bacterium]|nr:ATP-binding cassette domain-containing protein [Bacteroidota bacterium]HET6244760.1 ATP-binding cassette domain-containing protein [Bacteroidia bacterium]
MLEAKDLTIKFDGIPILKNLNSSFSGSNIHGIIGLNGSGKTTFFNCMAGVIKPDMGSFLWNGKTISSKEIGYIETSNYFYSNITGKEYLNIFPLTNKEFNLESFQELMHLPLQNLIETYSTGMKKKLALLAMVKQDKQIYIFDEPFNGLDMETNKILMIMIKALSNKGKTVFISSHILEPLLNICEQIHYLSNGIILKTFDKQQFGGIEKELFEKLKLKATEILKNAI